MFDLDRDTLRLQCITPHRSVEQTSASRISSWHRTNLARLFNVIGSLSFSHLHYVTHFFFVLLRPDDTFLIIQSLAHADALYGEKHKVHLSGRDSKYFIACERFISQYVIRITTTVLETASRRVD